MLNLLGIVAGVVGKITDTFTRSNTVSTLGNTETGQSWNILSGTWKINNNKAESTSTSTDYALASVELGSNNAKVIVDVTSGGVGPAIWVTSANSWWASSVNYRSQYFDTTGPPTCTGGPVSGQCSGGCGTTQSTQNCSWSYTGSTYTNTTGCPTIDPCNTGFGYSTSAGNPSYSYSCSGSGGAQVSAPTVYSCLTSSDVGKVCSRYYAAGLWYYSTCAQVTTYTCQSYAGPTYTTSYSCSASLVTPPSSGYYRYYTDLKIYNKNGGSVSTVQTSELTNNTSGYTAAGSIFISTSGDTITAKAFTGSALSGSQIGSTVTYNATSPNKGTAVGIIKTPSTDNQGSIIDNFDAETSV